MGMVRNGTDGCARAPWRMGGLWEDYGEDWGRDYGGRSVPY